MSNVANFPAPGEAAPLYNAEVEVALLGAIMVDNAAYFRVVRDLQSGHFYEPVHGRIYEAIAAVIDAGGTASPLTLKQYFETDEALEHVGGARYLYDMAASVVTVMNAADYATTIIDLWQRREIMASCRDIIGDLAKPEIDRGAAEIGSSLQRSIEATITQGSSRGRTRRDVLNAVVEDLRKPIEASPTGLAQLDAAMAGGLHKGRAYGIVGRKKIGKSNLGGTISYNLNEAGVSHLAILLEMGSTTYEQRHIGRALGFNALKFLQPEHRSDPEFQSMVADYAVTATDNTHYLDRPGMTFDQMQQQIVYFVHRHKIKGVILDYLQLVKGRPQGCNQAEHLDNVSQWVAQATTELGIWGLVLAQMNQDDNVRGGEAMRLAFDQVYAMKPGADERAVWLEMWDSRYTPHIDVGSKYDPALELHGQGPHFREFVANPATENDAGLFG